MNDLARTSCSLLVVTLFLLASCATAADRSPAAAPERPNVIVVLTDDQGWMDAGVYGSEYYETPNLDRLAARGVRFTNAYSASPLCSPTRLSVLTGMYPHRFGMTAPHGHLAPLPPNTPLYTPGKAGAPWQAYQVPEPTRYIPLDVQTFGTVFKDAGYTTAFIGKWHLGNPPHSPESFGFDLVLGGRGNPGPPGGFFAPWLDTTPLPKRPKGTHIDDAITDEALKFMADSHQRGRPFFVNLWFYNVHAPFQAKQPLIKKYRGKTDPRGKQDFAVMGGMLETMDDNLGRVMDQIDKLGLDKETIIVFWSDNGGNMYDEPEGTTPTHNAPLRAGKGNIHEGGIRVPAVIDWPGVTEAGSVSDAMVSTIDIFPTILQMAGLDAPGGVEFDGTGLEGLLKGGGLDRDAMFFHFPHYVAKPGNISASAVRQGPYKLIRRYDKDGSGPFMFELYDLENDLGETTNLAAEMPEKVEELDAMIAAHLEATGTPVPLENPAFKLGSYNPITGEGVKPAPPKNKRAGDWEAGGETEVKKKGGHLIVTSVNGDPYVMCSQLPEVDGPVVGRVRMKLETSGDGQMFWSSKSRRGFGGHGVSFDVNHDGQWHEYEVQLPSEGRLNGFRLDPGRDVGEITIDWIELADVQGETLKRWAF